VLERRKGKAFSAGVDVAAHTPDKVEAMLHKVPRSDSRHDRHKRSSPSAAVPMGICLGGGAELAMLCDIVYTSASSLWDFRKSSSGAIRRWRVTPWLRWSGKSAPRN